MSLPLPTKKLEIELPENSEKDSPNFPDFHQDKNGNLRISNTDENLLELAHYHGLDFRFNMMKFQPEVYEVFGDFVLNNFEQVRSKLISAASRYGLPKSAIDDHLSAVCLNQKYHPIKDWLNVGEWDGQKRVDGVIASLNAKIPEIAEIVLKRWLVACVASLYEPLFKSKLVPVLQGEQSFRKTAFVERLALLAPGAFLEGAELNPDQKDSVLTCCRHWIVELGELERTSKNSQGSLKAHLTKAVDTVRPPYARTDIQKPRQTNFLATVNGHDFLKDDTGSTRFAVIEMQKAADMDKLNKLLGWHYDGTGSIKQTDPNQLHQFWLEVKVMYDGGAGWQLSDAEVERIGKINKSFNDNGSWYDYILAVFIERKENIRFRGKWFTSGDLADHDDKLRATDTKQVGKALARLEKDGYLKGEKRKGNRKYYWII